MQRRLNISLPEDVLARADAFALRERYTRSGLIAAALEAFVRTDPRMVEVAGAPGKYPPEAVGVNPVIRGFVAGIISACRVQGVTFAGLVGESTRPDPAVVPREIHLLVRSSPEFAPVQHRLVLRTKLEVLTGLPVRITPIDELGESRRAELEPTLVVLYEADPLAAGTNADRDAGTNVDHDAWEEDGDD